MEKKLKTLLIVDDSLIIRKAISSYLEECNLEIVGMAHNGEVALKLFKEFNPNYVTLDISMPGPDGIFVLNEMIKINKSCKIMVITALADKATAIKAIRMGAKMYLTKPFNPKKLKEAFERMLVDD